MQPVTVVIATPLEDELVQRLREVDPRLDVHYEADLMPEPRYPSDHHGVEGFELTPGQQERYDALIASAEVLYGIPREEPPLLAWAVRLAPRLRFVQATFAGAGQQVAAAGLTRDELDRVAFASSAGVHATPLAEWSMLGLLAFRKDLPKLRADARERRWEHWPMEELRDATLLVVGVGEIGQEVARLAKAFGMHVVGIKRTLPGSIPHVDELHPPERLDELVGRADGVVVTLPLTDETRGLVSRSTIGGMKRGAIFVNVGRGGVVDEQALVEALQQGRLRGAALDVFATEPLPPGSPLWELPNVIVSPHTAALSYRENERIVELFADNLGRYLAGEPLRSRIDTRLFY